MPIEAPVCETSRRHQVGEPRCDNTMFAELPCGGSYNSLTSLRRLVFRLSHWHLPLLSRSPASSPSYPGSREAAAAIFFCRGGHCCGAGFRDELILPSKISVGTPRASGLRLTSNHRRCSGDAAA